MFQQIQKTELENEVWECLETVTDPELDEPVTDMGFIEKIEICTDQRKVEVEFRLPTYWCSPNFAFLMAFDIKEAVCSLPWTNNVHVQLNDHCFDDRVNAGVNGDQNFNDVFAEYCDGASLKDVREKFLEKAFIRRQEVVLLALEERGFSKTDIVTMTLETLDKINFLQGEEANQKPRYRALLTERGLAKSPKDLAFVTWQGETLTRGGLRDYLARLRGVRINMEFNGALCRGLAKTRYKEVAISEDGPTLIDFIQNRVPPRTQPSS